MFYEPHSPVAEWLGNSLQSCFNAGSTPVRASENRYGIYTVLVQHNAGWSSSVARRTHNSEVTGSNPVPATNQTARGIQLGNTDEASAQTVGQDPV
jgi:hypothetical protein